MIAFCSPNRTRKARSSEAINRDVRTCSSESKSVVPTPETASQPRPLGLANSGKFVEIYMHRFVPLADLPNYHFQAQVEQREASSVVERSAMFLTALASRAHFPAVSQVSYFGPAHESDAATTPGDDYVARTGAPSDHNSSSARSGIAG